MSDDDFLDMSAKYGKTTLSNYEIFMFGEALINWMGATVRVGHSSPGSLLDYTTQSQALGLGGLIMRDFVAWTSGRMHLVDGAEERMRDLIEASQIDVELAAKASALLHDTG